MADNIITGDTIPIIVPLTEDNNTFVIDPAATVTAVLRYKGRQITDQITCDSAADNADWTISTVAFEISPVQSKALESKISFPNTEVEIEIEIIENGVISSWLSALNYTIIKGTIDVN